MNTEGREAYLVEASKGFWEQLSMDGKCFIDTNIEYGVIDTYLYITKEMNVARCEVPVTSITYSHNSTGYVATIFTLNEYVKFRVEV